MEHSADSDIGLKTVLKGQLMHLGRKIKKPASDMKKKNERVIQIRNERRIQYFITIFCWDRPPLGCPQPIQEIFTTSYIRSTRKTTQDKSQDLIHYSILVAAIDSPVRRTIVMSRARGKVGVADNLHPRERTVHLQFTERPFYLIPKKNIYFYFGRERLFLRKRHVTHCSSIFPLMILPHSYGTCQRIRV